MLKRAIIGLMVYTTVMGQYLNFTGVITLTESMLPNVNLSFHI
jgi:hypothetical protein